MPYKTAVKHFLNRLSYHDIALPMAADSHISDFPSKVDLSAFLRLHWPKASDLSRVVTVSHNTVANWYREEPADISAANLFRVLIETGKLDAFDDWLRAGLRQGRPAAKRAQPRATSRGGARGAQGG